MLRENDGEIHNVKCVIYFVGAGKDFILGPKSKTL
jgi:hypothetical protein